MSQDALTEESLTAYEVSYAGVLSRGTTLGGSFFVNRRDDAINFTALPPSLDPYTATHPPPGWRLPPGVLTPPPPKISSQGSVAAGVAYTLP